MSFRLALCVLISTVSVGPAGPPAYRLRDKQMEYYGPQRESLTGGADDEIRIAWFGPDDPKHPEGGDLWIAAQMAVEEANAEGGFHGRRFRLLPVWSETPWDEGARRLAELVYRKGVVSIVGGIDGASTHVAEQIAAKARLPVISPVATDKSINLAGVPWMFSCMPADHLLAPALTDAIVEHKEPQRIVLLASTDHDSHLFTVELLTALRDRKMGLAQHYDFNSQTADVSVLVRQATGADPEAIVVVSDPSTSARLFVALREFGFAGDLYSGPAAARRQFGRIAKAAAEGVFVPLAGDPPESDQARAFVERFRGRTGHEPDFAAMQTYDTVSLVIAAVRKSGPNRVQLAEAIRALSPYEGIAGVIRWDRVGANTRAVHIGTYRNGRLVEVE